MVAVVIERKLQKTIGRSKSHHHLHASKLNRRKIDFKVSRQCHFTRWSHNGLRVRRWFNHQHDVCCCTRSNKGPLTVAGKVQNTVCALYCLVWATKLSLAAIGLVFPVLVLGYKSFNCSMYHVPVPTLFG
jgi:hypothetical protein